MSAHAADPHRPPRPSSLTDWLRGRSDDELARLLQSRPDLALPAPADVSALASRLSVRTSVQRAVDNLDAPVLRGLEVLTLAADEDGRVDAATVHRLAPAGGLGAAIDELLALGLVWGEPDRLHLTASVRESLGPYVAGLGRPAARLTALLPEGLLVAVLRRLDLPVAGQPTGGITLATALTDSDRLALMLADADPDEREILDRLAEGPPNGTVRQAQTAQLPTTATAAHRLIGRGLLLPIDPSTVELPREVGLAVRGGTGLAVEADPPDIPTVDRDPRDLDRTGTTAVLDVLRRVDTLGETWTAAPPAQLRAGGLGVRDLRRTARDLAVDEPAAALLIEVAAAAGLIGPTAGIEPVYLPTPDFDRWRDQPTATRWATLAAAWLAMTRQPALVGQRGDRERLVTALGPDVERGTAPALRTQVLRALCDLPPGSAPASRDAVLARLRWHAPRRASGQRPFMAAILAEADTLGVTAAGGATGYLRTLLDGSRTVAEQVLTAALPTPVDYLLVQPDLTIVVPGPPTPDLAADLAVAADLESTGGAHVYRITETSVRRALDTGRTGTGLLAVLTQRSRTPIPQALRYLIEDAARRHGALRVGTASAYLRSDDEALLARAVADRHTAALDLRRIAPTIAISGAAVGRTLEVLRASGYAPAAEAADGAVITLGADPPRAPARSTLRPVRSRAVETPAHFAELVRRIRSGETLSELTRRMPPVAPEVPGVTSATTMAALRDAIREGRRILIGYVDSDGTASRHTLYPISLAGGSVRGHEPGRTGLQSFALHRLTGVSLLADETDADPA